MTQTRTKKWVRVFKDQKLDCRKKITKMVRDTLRENHFGIGTLGSVVRIQKA